MSARRATARDGDESQKYNIRAIERAVSVLNTFTGEKKRLTLDEVTRETGLSKPTAFRILATLCQVGYLVLDAGDGRYRLGSVFLALGASAMGSISLGSVAKPHLASLRDFLQTTVLLGSLMDELLVYQEKMESPGPVRIAADIGYRRDPPHFGMLGMTLMAYQKPETLEKLLQRTPLKAYTQKSVTDRDAFVARLAKIRENGYCLEFGEAIEGVWGVAAPVKNRAGEVVAAVGAALPISSKDEEKVARAVVAVKEAAAAISKELGA